MAKKEFIEKYDPDELIIIGLDTEHQEGEHFLWDERAFWDVDPKLKADISVQGVNDPVKIRLEDGQAYVMDGRQRVKATRELKAEHPNTPMVVPCRVFSLSDSDTFGVFISSNELRREDSILTKALKASRLNNMARSVDVVAIRFGRTAQTIQKWLKLAEADPAVHEALREEKITATAAIEIAHKPREEQAKVLVSALRMAAAAPSSGPVDQKTVVKADNGRSGSGKSVQKGIKRSDIRRWTKTEAFKQLDREQQGVLQWIATGERPEEDEGPMWFEVFHDEVMIELGTTE